MFYDRHITKVIQRLQKRKPVLIITGARQVGKSTNLKRLLLDTGVAYITLDSPLLRESAIERPTAFLSENKPPIIMDEIQKVPALFEYIKIAVDEEELPGRYYLTGSHSFKLMRGVTESLAGRAGIIKMLGLSKRELNRVDYNEPFLPTQAHLTRMKDFHIPYSYDECVKVIHKGSYPELYKTETDLKDWTDYYTSYVQSYLEKDVSDLINAGNMSAFVKFLRAVASLTGEQLNYVTLAEFCGMNVNTVKNWLSILETGGLVYILQPYYNNVNSRLVKTPKLYFLDTGLACFLGGWNTPQQLVSGAKWGHIFETYVVSEVLKSYYNDGIVYPPLYYYRDKAKNEIDIVIEEGNTLYPVQIKSTTDPVKSMTAEFEILKKIAGKTVGEAAIICMAKDILPFANNTWVIPVDRI
jgi:predicted AAA+ superfamily ATPase